MGRWGGGTVGRWGSETVGWWGGGLVGPDGRRAFASCGAVYVRVYGLLSVRETDHDDLRPPVRVIVL